MKNDKFCFSKGTGLIALVGIVLVALALVMGGLSGRTTSTSTRAAAGTCRSGYSLIKRGTFVPAVYKNGKEVSKGRYNYDYVKQTGLVDGACEARLLPNTKFPNAPELFTLVNTGYKCVAGAANTSTLISPNATYKDIVNCKPACIYNGEDISQKGYGSIPPDPTILPTNKKGQTTTSYYLRGLGLTNAECIMERRDQMDGVRGRFTGKACNFDTIVMVGGYPSAKVESNPNCVDGADPANTLRLLNSVDNFLNDKCNVEDRLFVTQLKDSVADTAYAVGSEYLYMDVSTADHANIANNLSFIKVMTATVNTAIVQGASDATIKSSIGSVVEKVLQGYSNVGCKQANNKWFTTRGSLTVGEFMYSPEYVACMGYRGQGSCQYGKKTTDMIPFGTVAKFVNPGSTSPTDLVCGCRITGRLLKYPVVDYRKNIGLE